MSTLTEVARALAAITSVKVDFSKLAEAEIVFCPYNYILDPNIRETVSNTLNGTIRKLFTTS